MMAGAKDTGYTDGFIKDFSEVSDIVIAESSGYVHDAAKGVFRSINPALDSGIKSVGWTQAILEDARAQFRNL